MTAGGAFRDGIRRVNGAPIVVAGVFLLTLLVAFPLSYALRGMIEAHLGASLAADSAAAATNYDWWQEFSSQASGLATTFVPSITGFGAVLDNLDALLENAPLAATIAGATGAWMLLWSFLSGGIIDRFARARPTRSHGFFAASGTHFWRLLRLGLVAWLVYAFLFGYVHGWILQDAFGRLTENVAVERTAFAIRLAGYLLFGVILVICNVVFDYSRIRIVVEDRRSAIGGLLAGLRFVRRHAGPVFGLYLLNGVAFGILVLIYALISPGAPRGVLSMWLVLLLGEVYIVGRHYLKLLFYASETAFFQSALAHSGYTAAPSVVWPDSPAAESIANANSPAIS